MGHKSLAVLTVDRFNDEVFFFLQGTVWPFCKVAKKSGRNNEVAVLPRYLMAGFQCNAIFFFLPVSIEALCLSSMSRKYT